MSSDLMVLAIHNVYEKPYTHYAHIRVNGRLWAIIGFCDGITFMECIQGHRAALEGQMVDISIYSNSNPFVWPCFRDDYDEKKFIQRFIEGAEVIGYRMGDENE